mgnify:CR=1 FL=1
MAISEIHASAGPIALPATRLSLEGVRGANIESVELNTTRIVNVNGFAQRHTPIVCKINTRVLHF